MSDMHLSQDVKNTIDAKTYKELLEHWRFAPMGDPWLRGEVGRYWQKRMNELRTQPGGDLIHTAASKQIGWKRKPALAPKADELSVNSN